MKISRLALVCVFCAIPFTTAESAVITPPGLPDAGAAAAADKCQTAIKKAARPLVAKKLKAIAKCASAVSKCVQTKGSDGQCLTAAGKACTAALASVAAAQAKTAATITKKCNAVAPGDLLAANGLSFGTVALGCFAEFDAELADAPTIGLCVARQHDCRTGRLISFQQPRLDASVDLIDVSNKGEDACFTDYGGDGDLGDPIVLGKPLVKCQDAISKAGAGFVLAKLGSLEKCVDAVFTCIQKKPSDPACVTTKAHAKCDKAFTKIAAARTKLADVIDQKCAGFPIGSLGAANGGNVTALAIDCAAHGVAPLVTLADYEECLLRTHECLTEDLMFLEAPRANEMLGAVGRVLGSAFCPAPLPACQTMIHGRFRRYTAAAGAVFFDRTVDFDYTAGTVVLSSESDGSGEIFVDDEIIVDVTRPDTTTVTFNHDYSGGCSGQITHTAPADVTSLFQPGTNHVRVRFKNTCGANASADSLWLVGCNAM